MKVAFLALGVLALAAFASAALTTGGGPATYFTCSNTDTFDSYYTTDRKCCMADGYSDLDILNMGVGCLWDDGIIKMLPIGYCLNGYKLVPCNAPGVECPSTPYSSFKPLTCGDSLPQA